jgi:hypothetical protein
MKRQDPMRPRQEGIDSWAERPVARQPKARGAAERTDPRTSLAVQAMVAIPSLPPRAYGVCEISRGGMFLAFRNARSTRLELEQHKIEPGTAIEVAFTAALPDAKHRLRVQARIARITQHGIGIQFARRNPPQLAALRELFAQAELEPAAHAALPERPVAGERQRTRVEPPDSASWQAWGLED